MKEKIRGTEIKLYTVQEVSDILRVHYTTMYAWIASGKVNAVKVGRKLLITSNELDNIIKNGVNE